MEGPGYVAANMKMKKKAKPMRLNVWTITLIIAIIVLIAVIAVTTLGNSQTTTISNYVITSNPSTFNLAGSNFVVYLGTSNYNTSHIYLEKSPIPLNPLFEITLTSGSVTALNTNGNGNYANLEVKLISSSGKNATVVMEAINTSLQVPVNQFEVSVVNQVKLNSTAPANNVTTTIPKNGSTTTTSSTSTTTISPTTTTVNQTQITDAEVVSTLKKNTTYALVLNYSRLYANSVNCTSNLYNTTYISQKSTFPSGPSTYENASLFTPTALTLNVTSNGNNRYTALYGTVAQSNLTSGPAASFGVNLQSNTVVNDTLEGGIFSVGYTVLYHVYENATAIKNACGIVIVTG